VGSNACIHMAFVILIEMVCAFDYLSLARCVWRVAPNARCATSRSHQPWSWQAGVPIIRVLVCVWVCACACACGWLVAVKCQQLRHRSDAKYGAVARSSTPTRPGAHRGRLIPSGRARGRSPARRCPSKATGGACVARCVCCDWSSRSPRKVIVYRSLNRSIIGACSFS
jgi:hypothetical protein